MFDNTLDSNYLGRESEVAVCEICGSFLMTNSNGSLMCSNFLFCGKKQTDC